MSRLDKRYPSEVMMVEDTKFSRWGMALPIRRAAPSDLALAGLLAAYIGTLWAYPYFPTQDGPSHIYNSYILAQLVRGEGSLSDVFAIRKEPVPNWGGHALMAALIGAGVPPLGSEKVLVSVYLVGVALASRWLLRSVGPGQPAWSCWSVPLAFNFPLFMGFYNFALGVPVALALLAFAWQRRGCCQSMRAKLVLAALLPVLFVTHLAAYAVGLFLLAALTVLDGEKWRVRSRLDRVGAMALVTAPSLVLLAWYAVMSDGKYLDAGHTWSLLTRSEDGPFERLWRLAFTCLAPTPRHSAVLALVVWEGLALAAAWRIITLGRSKGIAGFSAVMARKGPILGAWAALLALAVLLPREWGHHGGYFTDRVAVFLGLLMLAWLPVPRGPRASHLPAVLGVVVGLALLHVSAAYLAEGNRFLALLREGGPGLPNGTRVLPLCSSTLAPDRVDLLEHVIDYDCMRPGVVNWDNYEAKGFCFPIRYAPGVVPPEVGPLKCGDLTGLHAAMALADVVLLWKPLPAIEAKVAAEFPAVARLQGLVIRSRRPLPPFP